MKRLLGAAGAFLGWLLWVLHVRRRVVMENLRIAFPEWTEAERRAVGRRTFLNLGRMASEFLTVTRLSREELERHFVYDGEDAKAAILAALAERKPVVVCTAHFGNFENLAAVHNLQGYPIAMVVRRLGGGWLGKLWNRGRSSAGLEVLEVTRGETLKAAQRAMREGKVLGYVIDQNMPGHRAVFPTFFGVPAATAPTPAYLAMRSGAMVFFMLDVPQEDGRHRIVVEGPIAPPDTGDREADVLAFLQDLNDRLERWVRKHPDRWYWLHRRWKTRPPAEGERRRRGGRRIDRPGDAG
ncbi:MAG TPA: lipid A biosynthesis acyltransferase [Anaeromyxobacteraceae bacterium]|nr:lipid A biosynthesis acyltransferase [Anaeromyxobacteraceae bacterium]